MVYINVKVKPSSRTSKLEQLEDGSYLAWLKAAPVDGKANAELIRLLATHFRVPLAGVRVKNGAGARFKRIEIDMV